VDEASKQFPTPLIIADGRLFAGRMTSWAKAASPFYRVKGLAFFGFPLHPVGKPSTSRAEHLFDIKIPMFFLVAQGICWPILKPLVMKLGPKATLRVFEERKDGR